MACFTRFKLEIFSQITGEDGAGPIRTYIHKESDDSLDLTLFSWPPTVFYYEGVPLDGNKVRASRNGREQEQESDILTEHDLQLIYDVHNSGKIIAEVI